MRKAIPFDRGWDDYTKVMGTGFAGREAIDFLISRGMTPNRTNIDAAIAAFTGTVTSNEKVGLAILLGRTYLDAQDAEARAAIEQALSSAALGSSDPAIGGAAALAYSRMGWFANWLEVLTHAYTAGHIGADSYFGDMAHVLPAAPPAQQLELLRRIAASHNEFAVVVLADILQNRDIVGDMDAAVAAECARLLANAQPEFFAGSDLLGMGDVFRYQGWVAARMVLNTRLGGGSDAALLAKILPRPDEADPRKLMALMNSEHLGGVVRTAYDLSTRIRIASSVDAYAQQHTDSRDTQQMAADTKSRLGIRN